MKVHKPIIALAWTVFALESCGTVAGNPRKPDAGGGGEAAKGAIYALPTVNFDLGDESLQLTPPADLQLAAFANDSSEKTLFNTLGRRFNSLIREINSTSKRLNTILETADARSTDPSPHRIKDAGKSGKLAAIIGPSDSADYAHSAVLCADGKPLQLLRWSDDGESMELWRDFSVMQGDDEANFSVTSRLRVKNTADGVTLDLASSGTWTDSADDDQDDGGGLVERVLAQRNNATGVILLRSATDRFSGDMPKEFSPDSYVSSRLTPHSNGVKGYDSSFIGYSKARKRQSCRSGFDETAADLWHPKPDAPQFCLSRAPAGERLKTFDQFSALVASFEAVGIVKKADLETVSMPSGLTCDK